MLLAASPTTPSAARRAATPVEASLATAAVVVAAMVAAAVAGRGRCSPLCAPTVAMTPRCRSARAVTGRSTAAIVSVACETKRGVVPLFAGVLKHLAVHSLTMAARCTFWFGPGGLEGIQVPLWQFQGFCVDLTHWTWSKCRFADAMLAASHRIAAGHAAVLRAVTGRSPTRATPYTQAGVKPAPWECHCCRPLSFGRRWRRVLCLAFAATAWEVRQSPLFRVAGASGSFALSRLTGFFDLAGHLGYEFEDSVFGVVRLDRGGFAVY